MSDTRLGQSTASAETLMGALDGYAERAERIEAAARQAVEALNFYESTTGAYANEQRVHVLDALRRLRKVLDA